MCKTSYKVNETSISWQIKRRRIMKRIIGFIVIALTFYFGDIYFPNQIQVGSEQTLILSTLLMTVISSILSLFIKGLTNSMKSAVKNGEGETAGCLGCIVVAIGLPLALLITPMRLWICESIFNDFTINGFWTYVILSVMFVMFGLREKDKDKDDE